MSSNTFKKHYIYNGPVMKWGKYIGDWYGETMAVNEGKARSNLQSQYKTEFGLMQNTKIELPGKITQAKEAHL